MNFGQPPTPCSFRHSLPLQFRTWGSGITCPGSPFVGTQSAPPADPRRAQPSRTQCAGASGRCPPSREGRAAAEAVVRLPRELSARSRRWWAGGARPRRRRNLLRPRLRCTAPSAPVRPGGRGGGGGNDDGEDRRPARCGATCASWCYAWPAAFARSSTPSASSPYPWRKERAAVAGSRRPKRFPGSRAADAAPQEGRAARTPQRIPAGRTGMGRFLCGRAGARGARARGCGARGLAWPGLLAGLPRASGRRDRASRLLTAVSDPLHSFPSFPSTPGVSPAVFHPESTPHFCVCLLTHSLGAL